MSLPHEPTTAEPAAARVPSARKEPGSAPGAEPDSAVDADGSAEPVSAVDADGSAEPDSAVDADGSAEPDSAVDADGSAEPDSAVDADGSAEPDSAVDADGSAEPDSRPVRFAVAPENDRPESGRQGSGRPDRDVHGTGPLDGAWWPRSRDLSLELPSLVGALDLIWGRITGVTVDPEDWPDNPEAPAVAGNVVNVSRSTPCSDPSSLLVLAHPGGRRDLLVIPPQTPYAVAVRLMAAASDPLNVRSASALLAQADPDRAGRAAWEAEGGPLGMVRPDRSDRATGTAA